MKKLFLSVALLAFTAAYAKDIHLCLVAPDFSLEADVASNGVAHEFTLENAYVSCTLSQDMSLSLTIRKGEKVSAIELVVDENTSAVQVLDNENNVTAEFSCVVTE